MTVLTVEVAWQYVHRKAGAVSVLIIAILVFPFCSGPCLCPCFSLSFPSRSADGVVMQLWEERQHYTGRWARHTSSAGCMVNGTRVWVSTYYILQAFSTACNSAGKPDYWKDICPSLGFPRSWKTDFQHRSSPISSRSHISFRQLSDNVYSECYIYRFVPFNFDDCRQISQRDLNLCFKCSS